MTTPLDASNTGAKADSCDVDDSPLVPGTTFTEADLAEATLAFHAGELNLGTYDDPQPRTTRTETM